MMPEYTIVNSGEIFEYEAVPESEYVEYEYIPVDCNQLVADDQEIILEPVNTVVKSHERISRKRSYKPVDELVRPGKKAKIPDCHLTEKQLISRNKRRARNREAAQRQRDRRLQKNELVEQKIEELETINKNWEEKYKILEEKYQKLEFQLTLEKRRSIGPSTSANQNSLGNGYQPAKLVQINERRRKPKNLKVTIPAPVQPTVFTPAPATAHAPIPQAESVSTATSAEVIESFCLNDFIKVDTPTAKHVEKMALSGQDSFFTLFDL